ncbi:hypothetical protein GCM10009801_43490 [Streptomyces albiaxialis]|uniref:Thiamine pyrophosphate enzyme N-terminal TPP-binding domain-containing protein n=1 Tax=Streptomyces albiaxialis TaxID=329523 RepID=A0ABN2W4I3_9ACTN
MNDTGSALSPIDTAELTLGEFGSHGFLNFTGVPCSYLKEFFQILEEPVGNRPPELADSRFVLAPREDTALGLASGLTIGGAPCVVLMQNSGLGYSLNVLSSFNIIYGVSLPIIISWRGQSGADAIEHQVMGDNMLSLLDLFGLPWTVLDRADPRDSVSRVVRALDESGTPACLIVQGSD